MKNKKTIYQDFEVDRLTNSIENAVSGEVFDTLIVKITDGKETKKMIGYSIGILKFIIA